MSAVSITLTLEMSDPIDRFIPGQETKQGQYESVNRILSVWRVRVTVGGESEETPHNIAEHPESC